tara:strand:- start:2944 stop:3111 length:168 start_codon:yes stop_codon:yes gene_type:complete
MNITDAQYVESLGDKNIKVTIDGQVWFVPLDPNNRHYAEILRQVEEKKLTIKESD